MEKNPDVRRELNLGLLSRQANGLFRPHHNGTLTCCDLNRVHICYIIPIVAQLIYFSQYFKIVTTTQEIIDLQSLRKLIKVIHIEITSSTTTRESSSAI